MADAPKVTVLTLSWNKKFHTLEWLDAVGRLEYSNFDVLVVDNGSSDGSPAAIRKRNPSVTVIENGANLGYSRGFNVGMEYAFGRGADYVLVMNNDAVIDPEALDALVAVAQTDPKIGFTSGKVFHYFRPEEIQTVGTERHPYLVAGRQIGFGEADHGQYEQVAEREISDDVFLLVSKAAFQAVGGYDPEFFIVHENVDWCIRLREAGYRIMYAPGAKIWHKGKSGGGWSAHFVYYQTRNDYVLVAKHVSRAKALVAAAMLALFLQPRWFLFRVRPTKLLQFKSYVRGQASGLGWLLRHAGQRRAAALQPTATE
ncbi:MAG: glycosyltransferase family 2 protein [Dehalococcoidia bacterium]